MSKKIRSILNKEEAARKFLVEKSGKEPIGVRWFKKLSVLRNQSKLPNAEPK